MSEPQAIYHTSESERQALLVEALLRSGALVIRVNSGRSHNIPWVRWGCLTTGWKAAGVSDLIAIFPDGEIIFCEVKAIQGRYSDEQDTFRYELEQRGAKYLTVEQVYKYLEGK